MAPRRAFSAAPRGPSGMAKEQEEAREAQDAHFWELQDLFEKNDTSRGGLPKKGYLRLQQEEEELFGNVNNVGIDFDKYDSIEVERSGPAAQRIPVAQTYSDLRNLFPLPHWLSENLERCGYSKPTPVQKYAVPAALVGRDIMVCAQTGSGKTCAFLLPLITAMDPAKGCQHGNKTFRGAASPMGVVMSPTRELCAQIHVEARKLTFKSSLRALVVYGGVTAWHQIKDLARGVDILTATPGRLQDFMDRGLVSAARCEFCVLDEADRMLDMGFEPAIRKIVLGSDMPSSGSRQTMMFSATFAREIQIMAQDFLFEYVWIAIGRVGGACTSVTQMLVKCKNSDKPQLILDHLRQDIDTGEKLKEGEQPASTIIFCGMKKTCTWLSEHLRSHGISAGDIHGEREQWEREKTLREFKTREISCMVASDVAARGLDIPKVSLVINYDLPGNIDDYVHRIGRTGRAGHRGVAIGFFVAESETGFDEAGRNKDINNLNIAPQLQEMLQKANQEVPKWLDEVAQIQSEKASNKHESRSQDARRRHRSSSRPRA